MEKVRLEIRRVQSQSLLFPRPDMVIILSPSAAKKWRTVAGLDRG